MSLDILINQFDEHNQGNILATKKFSPKEVIFIRDSKEINSIKSLKRYYKENIPGVIFKEEIIEEGDNKSLVKLIDKNKDKDIIVNLTGGKRINSLLLLNLCKNNKIKSIYVDIKMKILYKINDDIDIIKQEFEDLEIGEIVKAAGGKIITDSTILSNKEDLIYLTKKIYTNLHIWNKYKQKLYDGNIFIHNYKDSKKIIIETKLLDNTEKQLLMSILKKLKEMKGITYKELESQKIEVDFLNDYLKAFIFKSGTWLELATNIMINEIKEIDEVRSGVIFLWNDDSKNIRNELDVVAVRDSVPICISCKDSDKYNEVALNELNVYSSKIGGDKVYKILVATKEPIKSLVKERAKEMGINLVIFDGDENKFKKEIQNIIKIR